MQAPFFVGRVPGAGRSDGENPAVVSDRCTEYNNSNVS